MCKDCNLWPKQPFWDTLFAPLTPLDTAMVAEEGSTRGSTAITLPAKLELDSSKLWKAVGASPLESEQHIPTNLAVMIPYIG